MIMQFFYRILPLSEIPLKDITLNDVFLFHDSLEISEGLLRLYSVFSSEICSEFIEIFLEPSLLEVSYYHIFKDYKCNFINKSPKVIPKNTLVYFCENDINWNHDIYYYCKESNDIIYPEKNSLVLYSKDLYLIDSEEEEQPFLKIIMGKKI